MTLGVALAKVAAEIMLNRVHSVAGGEQYRRTEHPPGKLLVSIELHLATKTLWSVVYRAAS